MLVIGLADVMHENSLGAWIAAYAELSCLVSAVDAPKLGALFYWCYTITRIVSAVVSSKISSTKILAVCYLGGVCGFVLVVLSGVGEGSSALLWVGTAILGVFVGPIFPSGLTLFAVSQCCASIVACRGPQALRRSWLVASLINFAWRLSAGVGCSTLWQGHRGDVGGGFHRRYYRSADHGRPLQSVRV
eukprot:COSAG06_NODE_9257_length_1945_cov_2.456121_2_plen_189_part_00